MLAWRKTRRHSTPLSMPTHLVMSIWFSCRSIPSGTAFEPSLASKFCFNSVGLRRTPNRKCAATDQVLSGRIVGNSEGDQEIAKFRVAADWGTHSKLAIKRQLIPSMVDSAADSGVLKGGRGGRAGGRGAP